jgi:hypothetical protein
VAVEFLSGRRFAHERQFTTQAFPRHEAEAKAELLAARIRVKLCSAAGWVGPVDNDNWYEMYPAYGSEWYQGQGRGDAEMKTWEETIEEESHFFPGT